MTVRWKPLVILSGLFLLVALIGVVAITLTLVPRSSQSFLRRARMARESGRFEEAEIDYKQALQLDAKDATVHEEFASFYRDWAKHAPGDKRTALLNERHNHLESAVKFDKAIKSPRLELLKDALRDDLVPESNYWAKEVLKVEPDNLDAHFVLALEALENRTPNVPDVRRHLETLEKKKAPAIRRLLVRAKLGEATGDKVARDQVFEQARAIKVGPESDPADRMAGLRIVSLAIRVEARPARLDAEVSEMLRQVNDLGKANELAPARAARVRALLEQTQRALILRSTRVSDAVKKGIEKQVDAIEINLESIFNTALVGEREPDIHTYLAYADHLRFRQQRDRCLQVIDRGLKLPQASRPTAAQAVMRLHVVAVEMALSRGDDQARFEKAAPHIQALLDCPDQLFQGFGHLFAGSVDLDRSGTVREMEGSKGGAATKESPAYLRASALHHLKIAAAFMPEIAEAQARYGVALVLAGEQNLGRQFLQTALRLGSLDSQYQLWAAWTILQAGYPEEAEPIVNALFGQVATGDAPRELEGSLHLLSGEIHQAKRSPEELNKAVVEYEKALAASQQISSTVIVRLAQVDVQLGHYDRALARIDALVGQGKGTAATEQLAVLTLEQQGKTAEAGSRLRAARTRYPTAADLAGIDAALLDKDGKPAEADKVLENFLAPGPDNPTLVMMRAQIQAESLKDFAKARSLLLAVSEKTENSAPLVQLAGLELERNQLDQAQEVIAKIRTRWKEAATGDVLEAQLALKRGQTAAAIEHFDTALKKDPENKIVQYWKAQLDGQNGAVAEATKSLESIVRNKPIKEVDAGTTLMSAAQSALASLSLRTGALDDAIRRFEELRRSNQNGTLTRGDRWQLITAYAMRGQWTAAKREIGALLNDSTNPPTDDERVRGANLYRQEGDEVAAVTQLDYVLQKNPTHTAAVVTRSFIMLKAKQHGQATAILHKAIEYVTQKKDKVPPVFYLMLATVANDRAPNAEGLKEATAILDQGLERLPDALELVQAKYGTLKATGRSQEAIQLVEAKAKAYPAGQFRRELVNVYREQKLYDRAAILLRELLVETPDDTNLSAALVQVVSLAAGEAGAANQPDRQRELNDQAARMIRQYRERYPNNLVFLQAECDLVARRGDFSRAIELTREIDKASKTSPMGALLRARLYAALGQTRDLAQAYKDALDRNPRQIDLRVLLGQTKLKLGEADEALRQANVVLDAEKNRPDALLLQARALAESGTTISEKDQQQQAAVARLISATKANPNFDEAYHTLAELHLKRNNRAAAIAVLKENLKANPNDATAAAKLIEILALKRPADKAARGSDLEEAKRLAHELTSRDPYGPMILAVAAGFHKARQLELALPYAVDAATKLDTPSAHLNLGDLLLTLAETQTDPERGASFERAVSEYDKVLKKQPNSIEAVNNKAWILHAYLRQTRQALGLVLSLQKRVNPAALPGEFYDTLGSIQESVGKTREAEQSYLTGLNKAPEHPVLNFHFGKMIAADSSQKGKARTYLKKALEFRDRLSPPMTQEATRLVQQIDGNTRIQ
jgi:tetratricopeptide (TPR) repeat protein